MSHLVLVQDVREQQAVPVQVRSHLHMQEAPGGKVRRSSRCGHMNMQSRGFFPASTIALQACMAFRQKQLRRNICNRSVMQLTCFYYW